jgi:RNA polymerase sigma-70 factor (ECF subfamily)
LLFDIDRDFEEERRAGAALGLHPDATAMHGDNTPGNRQGEPCITLGLCGGVVSLLELLFDLVGRVDARSGVAHREHISPVDGNPDRADDLVQETLLRALANVNSFEPGTNMSAWLFTILRNLFRSEYRKRRREVEDADGSYAQSLTSLPNQSSHLELDEFRKALELLPTDQRESLILVGASGFSYEEAAQICGCAVGTIKSRVNRARSRLAVARQTM